MRIFVAGTSGVIAKRPIPLLVTAGHEVTGMTRTRAKLEALRALGAEPVMCDAFDRDALGAAMTASRPDAVIHPLADLADDPTRSTELSAANSRMHRQGTRNLLSAANVAGVHKLVTQSIAWSLPGDGGAAVEEHERAIRTAGGTVLRYGRFYDPGTYFDSELPSPPRVHIDDAARRTLAPLEMPSGAFLMAQQ